MIRQPSEPVAVIKQPTNKQDNGNKRITTKKEEAATTKKN